MYESTGSARRTVVDLEESLRPSRRDGARIRILGHRGFPGAGCPENSAAAVTRALRNGADGVEIDVRRSADGVLVCSHDACVHTRTGALMEIATSASGELIGTGPASLATLPELLRAAQRPGGARVVVEAKPVPDAVAARRTADALAEVLGTASGVDVTVSSFSPGLLAVIRAACADLPVRTALLGDKAAPADAVVWCAHEDGHDEVHLPLIGLRRAPEVMGMARLLGLSVAVWTVNRKRNLRWVAALGVDAVITDDVARARRKLNQDVVGELTAA